MSGFLVMLLATTLDFLLKPIGSPAPPWYPIRLLGAAGGIVCLHGLSIALNRRLRSAEVPWRKSAFSDWFFPVLLAVTVITGLFTEIAVYLPMNTVGHAVFFVHVFLAMDLVALLPLTKFAHALYRTLALVLFAWRHAPVLSDPDPPKMWTGLSCYPALAKTFAHRARSEPSILRGVPKPTPTLPGVFRLAL
jgi:hypothetical protein